MESHSRSDFSGSASREKSGSHAHDPEVGSVGTANEGGPLRRFVNSFRPVEIVPLDPNMPRRERAIKGTADLPMKRALSNRHMQMIAIGGSIGAGLFVSTGNALVAGGPAGMLIGYFLIGILVFTTMVSLGELAVRYPVSGAFSSYATRFVDPSWGFAIGWCYTLEWLLSMPTELVAASVTINYWKGDDNGATNVNKAAWVALFWSVIAFINVFGVRGYGEAEVFFSSIKVLAIIGFIIFGIIVTCGGGPTHEYIGGRYWHHPGAFSNGVKGVCQVFVSASYAFSGTEFAGLAAAETARPQESLPKATKQVAWRLVLFYFVSIIMIGCLVPYTDSRLGVTSDGSSSPFVIAIKNAQVKALPSIMNTVIILAVLSVGNAAVFGSTRTVVALAAQGHAPRFFLYIDRKGRPVIALLLALLFGLIGFVVAAPQYSNAFNWLSAVGGLAGLFTWLSINVCYIRNRLAMKQHGISVDELEYRSPFGIYGAIVGALLALTVLGLNVWVALFPLGKKHASAYSFFQTWLSLCIMVACFAGHKLWFRDPILRTNEIDVTSGVRVKNREELRQLVLESKERHASRSWLYRFYKLWC